MRFVQCDTCGRRSPRCDECGTAACAGIYGCGWCAVAFRRWREGRLAEPDWSPPVEPRGRGYRFEQRERTLRRARRLVRLVFGVCEDDPDFDDVVRAYAADRKPCSCAACSQDKRRFAGPTRQELLADVP